MAYIVQPTDCEIFVIRRVLGDLLEIFPDLQDFVVGCDCRCHPILRDKNLEFRFMRNL